MATGAQHESVQCADCGKYIDPFKGFVCKGCRRRPLCIEHRDQKMRGFCLKCANRMRREKLEDLRSGVRSLKTFLRFIQFLFLVFAILFSAQRLIPAAIPEAIATNAAFKHIYIPGALCALGFVVLYFIYLGQKRSVEELEHDTIAPTGFAHRVR